MPHHRPASESFEHRGRVYRLFKRAKEAKAPWYCHYQFEGRRYLLCSKTNTLASAIKYFKAHLDASWNGRLQVLEREQAEAAQEYSTIGALLEAIDTLPLDIASPTRRQYVNCLRNVIRCVKGDDMDLLPCSVLDAEFVGKYFEAAVLKAQSQRNQAEAKRVKRTANSIFNQAKALLRPKITAALRRLGLVLPSFGSFEQSWKEERFEGVSKSFYNPPADSVIRETLHAWTRLEDRNHFMAVGLELAFGLRKSEVAQARWSWFTTLEGQPFLAGDAAVKAGHGRIQVRALDPFWTVLRKRMGQWKGLPDAYVLAGTKTERTETVFRTIGAWMRELGWRTQKTSHAFRAYGGSQVAMRYGVYSAFTWLRHSSVTVTEQNYSHFIESHKVDSPRRIKRRWARV